MKIVINDCFGGFGLSMLAEMEYLKLLGKECHFYTQTKYSFKDGENLYEKCIGDKDELISFTFTQDLGESFSGFPEDSGSFYASDIKRDDPNLIKIVETLKNKANGGYAELKIVEIPDNTKWQIDEYDGTEWIAEKYQTWG